jgi:hypothetical protein
VVDYASELLWAFFHYCLKTTANYRDMSKAEVKTLEHCGTTYKNKNFWFRKCLLFQPLAAHKCQWYPRWHWNWILHINVKEAFQSMQNCIPVNQGREWSSSYTAWATLSIYEGHVKGVSRNSGEENGRSSRRDDPWKIVNSATCTYTVTIHSCWSLTSCW